MRDLRSTLNRIDNFAHANVALSFVELAPRRQWNQIDRIRVFDLGTRWLAALPSPAANLSLVPPVAPSPNENLLAHESPRAMHTGPLDTARNKSLFDAL